METPLYTALTKFRDENPLRLHIPGHKGKEIPQLAQICSLDFTELSVTGNLYEGGEPFHQAQQLWAARFGFHHAQFLTGGSTQGIYTALAVAAKAGDRILLDRGCHRSAVHAMGLLKLKPVYLQRPWLSGVEVPGGFSGEDIKKVLEVNPDIKTVFITSPTYCGVLSDIPAIAQVVHEHQGTLIVDGAHGCHLPWLGIDHFSKADLVTVSVHKTLPALGQSAVLLYQQISPVKLREIAAIFGTSSPSYPILASIDLARGWMDEEGGRAYQIIAAHVGQLRRVFPSLTEPIPLDPLRFTLLCNEGQQIAEDLERKNVYVEMANQGHIVVIFTGMDSQEEVYRFARMLPLHLEHRLPLSTLQPPREIPPIAMEMERVMTAEKEVLPLSQCLNRIAGMSLAPYPPGVPVVTMGEVITKEILEYFEKISYQNEQVLVVVN